MQVFMKRLMIFVLIAGSLWTAEAIWLATRQPEISAGLAVGQLNGGADAARRLREFETFKNISTEVTTVLTLFAALVCFDSVIRRNLGLVMHVINRSSRRAHLLLLSGSLGLLFLTSGCI